MGNSERNDNLELAYLNSVEQNKKFAEASESSSENDEMDSEQSEEGPTIVVDLQTSLNGFADEFDQLDLVLNQNDD